jgi:hypothetical protein
MGMYACMVQSVGFWVSPTLLQSMACIDGLDGCDFDEFDYNAKLEEFI